jgi:hypothetical protein
MDETQTWEAIREITEAGRHLALLLHRTRFAGDNERLSIQITWVEVLLESLRHPAKFEQMAATADRVLNKRALN